MKFLLERGFSFSVIDVDPWTTSKPYFTDALKLLDNTGLLMLTLGDQYPWPKNEALAWERFGVELYNDALSEGIKQEWRRNWMFQRFACAWYMRAAVSQSVCLLPIVLMRNFEPWSLREDFSYGVMGVDRIYFLAKRVLDLEKLEQFLHYWTEPLPILDGLILRTTVSTQVGQSGKLSFISFIEDIWPAMKPWWLSYYEWLNATANDLASRWRIPESPNVTGIRISLRRAIEHACFDKMINGFHLANSWLRKI